MTTTVHLFHGAWSRGSVSVDGGPRFETQRVVWLQAATCFADLRVPFHPAADERCFAGTSGPEGDRYRWTHRLDLEGSDSPAADDMGDLTWVDGVVIERGLFPTAAGAVAYEEVWVPLPSADGCWQVLESQNGCLLRVGCHSLVVVDGRPEGEEFRACYRVLGPAGWRDELTIGGGEALPLPGDTPPGWWVVSAGDSTAVAV